MREREMKGSAPRPEGRARAKTRKLCDGNGRVNFALGYGRMWARLPSGGSRVTAAPPGLFAPAGGPDAALAIATCEKTRTMPEYA